MEPKGWVGHCLSWKAYSERTARALGCSQMEESKGHRRGFHGPRGHLRREGQEWEGRKAGPQFIPVQPLRHITVSPRVSLLSSEGSKDLATFRFLSCHFQLARGFSFPLIHCGATCSSLALRKAPALSGSLEKPDRDWETSCSTQSPWLYFLYSQQGKGNMMMDLEFTENGCNAHLGFKWTQTSILPGI